MSEMNEAFIVSAVRTAVGKAGKGAFRHTRPEQLGGQVVRAAIERVPGLEDEAIDDVLIGCAMPEGPQGLNMGRIIAQVAGLPDAVPGATINRFCSSGLQTIAMASQAIGAGHAQVMVAGGAETMSLVPMAGFYYQPDPALMADDPDMYVSMGNTAENVASRYDISREDQDAFALRSHQNAIHAIDSGRFQKEIHPISTRTVRESDSGADVENQIVSVDEGPRRDTNAEALSRLKPVFRVGGTVTAGNSSQMSDGAAALVVMSASRMKAMGAQPLARLAGFAVAGVAPEVMGIGPIEAVPKVLRQTGLQMKDIGLVELNEAFASQSLAVIRTLDIDPEIVNVNGGAIALGHPLGCTGAKLTTTLIHEMRRRSVRYGLCTMCIGGGMGAAGVIELLESP